MESVVKENEGGLADIVKGAVVEAFKDLKSQSCNSIDPKRLKNLQINISQAKGGYLINAYDGDFGGLHSLPEVVISKEALKVAMVERIDALDF